MKKMGGTGVFESKKGEHLRIYCVNFHTTSNICHSSFLIFLQPSSDVLVVTDDAKETSSLTGAAKYK